MSMVIGVVLTCPLVTGMVAESALGAALPDSVQEEATVADNEMS